MALNIKIENFEGPFDLLLHLIKKNEMDIYDVSIYEITSQYMALLKEMQEMDLEITSEFIVVAATLIEIKSKLLLPKQQKEDDSKEVEDPREFLISKLLEYKKFKAAAEFFKNSHYDNGYCFSKKAEIIDDSVVKFDNSILKNMSMLDLYNIYNTLMANYKNKSNVDDDITKRFSIDKYKVEDKILFIQSILGKDKRINFTKIITLCENKIDVIVTFLAILELARMKNVTLWQEESFEEIYVEKVNGDGESDRI